jgi:hypothetical protein
MKRNYTIIGLLVLLLTAGSACHRTWHDRRGMNDSGRMIRMRMTHGWMGYRRHFMRHSPMQGMQGNMGFGMMKGMDHGMGFSAMRGMGRMPMDSIGRMPMAPGIRVLESIPNVTENQKKQIEDLMKKNQEDMKKLREEMSSKMQSLMDSHRKEVLNVLSDDQKKYMESEHGKTDTSPESTK